MSTATKKNVSAYVDGFNFYHAVCGLEKNHLKWMDYFLLARSFLRKGEDIRRVYFFTSLTVYDERKKARHNVYMNALRARGVDIVESEFKKSKKYCRKHDRYCKFWEEKKNDVSIAVQMIADAHDGNTHRMILISADTDQIPTINYIKQRFPEIELTLGIPPGRKDQARDLGDLFNPPPTEITEGRINAVLLPERITAANGAAIIRPPEYAPPTVAPADEAG